jgi:hypothetical protein
MRLLIVVALSWILLGGCGTAGGASRPAEPEEDSGDSTTASSSSEGGTTVGAAIAEADLKPVGDSGTSGNAVFKVVGNLGVEAELDVSGLPTENSNATYYAQIHEGSCSDERTSEEEQEEHGVSPALALVRLNRLLAKVPRLQAHGGHDHGIPEEPPGSIEQRISFSASADGTASVASLLESVEPKRLTSGGSEYVHLHAEGPEDAPELACGDLKAARE